MPRIHSWLGWVSLSDGSEDIVPLGTRAKPIVVQGDVNVSGSTVIAVIEDPAEGVVGKKAPKRALLLGGIDSNGNFQALKVDEKGRIHVVVESE
jgi:hypothetical protein